MVPMLSVLLPERFSLNNFSKGLAPFGTQLNEFSRVFQRFQFQKDPENRVSSLVAAKKKVTCRKNLVKKIALAKMTKIMQTRCAK